MSLLPAPRGCQKGGASRRPHKQKSKGRCPMTTAASQTTPEATPPALHIGMLLFPGLTQLDLTGPFEVLHRLPGARVHLVWKDTEAVRAESGLALLPTASLDDCPPLDILFVPGGLGQAA